MIDNIDKYYLHCLCYTKEGPDPLDIPIWTQGLLVTKLCIQRHIVVSRNTPFSNEKGILDTILLQGHLAPSMMTSLFRPESYDTLSLHLLLDQIKVYLISS